MARMADVGYTEGLADPMAGLTHAPSAVTMRCVYHSRTETSAETAGLLNQYVTWQALADHTR